MIIRVKGVRHPQDRAQQLCKKKYSGKALKACLRGVWVGTYSSWNGIKTGCKSYFGRLKIACRDGAESYLNESLVGLDGRRKKSRKSKARNRKSRR